ncbi:glycosyltransferase [candidate division WWE3 bacterium]|jgi:glycosyltransferase involved in cell wall biosynthesis|uniref:Glycosyltransferase n=1 Tax=candidate division WWE3 bacterium TaxID=2053526 RepID=A0A3A4ZLJ0_UNCKA|nr:MAG: glycosyltransferase [candidate division WWE3 bacterium]
MKIAFEAAGGVTWQAGLYHPMTFSHALKQTYGSDVTVYFLLPNAKCDVPDELSQVGVEIINISALRKWTALWIGNRMMKRLFMHDILRCQIAKIHSIDAIFGLVLQYQCGNIPTLSWIPDFQHIHLPEMFSTSERRQRDRTFLQTAKLSTRIILTSNAVKRDFEAFAPQYADKARVIQTVSYIPKSIYEADPKSVVELYNLPEKFVYLPNQFWKHKNHELVFRALNILKERNVEVFVVCSGYPGDYRYASYFADLLQKLSKWGIRNQVAFLGLVPRNHVLLLIRQAICVLNPSLFEGFGLTVDEARSIGKCLLLSDIPAHREQNPPKAVFFDPYSCEDLAEKLSTIWCEALPGPDIELEREARQTFPARLRACAESFMSVIREVSNR